MSVIPDETAVFDDFTIRTSQQVDYEAPAIVARHATLLALVMAFESRRSSRLLMWLLGPRDVDRPLDGDDVDEALLRAFDGSMRLEPTTTSAIAAELAASGAVC